MALEYLENIGRARDAFKSSPGSPVEKVLSGFAEMQIALAKEALVNGTPKHEATGSLSQSISFNINTEEGLSLEFLMNDYWDFINSGVNGIENSFGAPYDFKSVNPSPIMIDAFVGTGGLDGWMRAKGITSLNYTDQLGNNITEELVTDDDFRSAAYVLARATKKKGIQGNNFINNVFNEEALQRFEQDLLDAIANTF